MEFLDAITEGDIAREDDTDDENDTEDATEDAGPSTAVPSTWYGCLWFFLLQQILFFSLVLILYALLSGMPALG